MHVHTVPTGAPNLMFNWISDSLAIKQGKKKKMERWVVNE